MTDRDIKPENLAEQYRATLGLLPWDEHRAEARATHAKMRAMGHRVDPFSERRTGRTVRGILFSIARSIANGMGTLYVYGGTHANTMECVHVAREFVAKLGLALDVRPLRHLDEMHGRRERGYEHVDHYAHEHRRSQRIAP